MLIFSCVRAPPERVWQICSNTLAAAWRALLTNRRAGGGKPAALLVRAQQRDDRRRHVGRPSAATNCLPSSTGRPSTPSGSTRPGIPAPLLDTVRVPPPTRRESRRRALAARERRYVVHQAGEFPVEPPRCCPLHQAAGWRPPRASGRTRATRPRLLHEVLDPSRDIQSISP